MGLELAETLGVMMVARAKGRHFLVYHGADRIDFDAIPVKGQAADRRRASAPTPGEEATATSADRGPS